MKIVFFCSSLEPGRDGVGDYVRLLASQLKSMGHECSAIAMSDEYIQLALEQAQPTPGSGGLDVLRIPAKCAAHLRLGYVKNWICKFNPEWISLQYVGFGYHAYGLPFKIIRLVESIAKGVKIHIMFHELWCGMPQTAGTKEKLLGQLQKLFIQWMVGYLKPQSIFTSIESYASYLKKVNIGAAVVPIFSNIVLDDLPQEEDWNMLINTTGIKIITEKLDDWQIFAFFGTVYNRPGLKELIANAAKASRQVGKKFGILSIGHGRGLDIDALTKDIPDAQYWRTGALSPGLINNAMAIASFGVVTSTADGINKSGTAVAWLERGVPIIISGEDESYVKEIMIKQGIFQILSPADIILAMNAKGNFTKNENLDLSAKAYADLAHIN